MGDSTSFFSFNFRQQQQAATRCAWHAPHKEAKRQRGIRQREMRQTKQAAGEAEMWNDYNNEAADDDDEVELLLQRQQ